jgi:hypothetical protein
MAYILRPNHSKYPTAVLCRFKAVHTVLAALPLRLETFTLIEVATFFKL